MNSFGLKNLNLCFSKNMGNKIKFEEDMNRKIYEWNCESFVFFFFKVVNVRKKANLKRTQKNFKSRLPFFILFHLRK